MVARDAFMAYSQYCVMQLEDAGVTISQAYDRLSDTTLEVAKKFREFVVELTDGGREGNNASRKRNALAKNVISQRQDLLRYTPEAKGMLIYLLTRHGKWDRLDYENRGTGLITDLFQARKEAVLCVLLSIQTRAEWRKVLCRITVDGSNVAEDADEVQIEKEQEQSLVDFLQLGFNRDHDLHNAKRELVSIWERLRVDVAWGYALAMNDSMHYKLNIDDNPHYPQRCTFGPCDERSSSLV